MLPTKCYKETYMIPFNTTKLVFTSTSSFYLFVETTKNGVVYALGSIGPPKIPPPNYVLVVVHIIGRCAARVFWPGRVSRKVCDVVVILVSLKRVRTGVSKGKIGGGNELGPFAPLRSSRSCRGSQEGG